MKSPETFETEQAPVLWSQLPPELLDLVAAKLIYISDYIRFRSVCRSWRCAARPGRVRPQPPLLMLPYHPFTDARSFFSLSTGRAHALSLPESYGKIVLNSAHGWLVMLDIAAAALCLLNPITGAQIRLPPTADFYRLPRSRVSPDLRNYEIVDRKGRRDALGFEMSFLVYPWEVFLSSNPISAADDEEDEDCFVFVSVLHSRDIIYCKPGDEEWTVARNVLAARAWSIARLEGRLYVVDGQRNLYVFDMAAAPSALVLTATVPVTLAPQFSLTCTRSRELFLVAHDEDDDDDKEVFQAFRLDASGGSPEWIKVRGAGERAVFWSERQCWVVDVGEFHGCREDRVYLSDVHESRRREGRARAGAHQIDVFDMKDGGFEVLSCGWEWEKPRSGMMGPFWVTISLG